MSQTITQRLNGVVYGKAKSLAMGQHFATDVSACYAPVLNEAGQMTGLEHSWLVTVSIPNPLLGQPDIAVSVPIQGVVPPAPIFEKVTEHLWEKVMEAKQKTMKPSAVGMDLSGVSK